MEKITPVAEERNLRAKTNRIKIHQSQDLEEIAQKNKNKKKPTEGSHRRRGKPNRKWRQERHSVEKGKRRSGQGLDEGTLGQMRGMAVMATSGGMTMMTVTIMTTPRRASRVAATTAAATASVRAATTASVRAAATASVSAAATASVTAAATASGPAATTSGPAGTTASGSASRMPMSPSVAAATTASSTAGTRAPTANLVGGMMVVLDS